MDLPCIVEYVRYRQDDGFAILSCNLNAYSDKYNDEVEELVQTKLMKKSQYDNFTVTVGMLAPEENPVGRQCIFVGDLFEHPKYGAQFKSEFFYQDNPTTEEGLITYLMLLPHVKEVRSKKIIDMFGVEGTFEVLDKKPLELVKIAGITEERAQMIKEAWDNDQKLRELFMWLSSHGISPQIGRKIFNKWKHDSLKILAENPYRLTEIKGIGFIMADGMAHKILDDIQPPHRTTACIEYLLKEDVQKNSNLCTPYGILKQNVLKTLKESNESMNKEEDLSPYYKLISPCIRNNLDKFVALKDKDDEKGKSTVIYLYHVWEMEKCIAHELYARSKAKIDPMTCTDTDIENAERDIERLNRRETHLDDCQKEAVKSAFENNVTVITGAGGTGKSTICRAIFFLAEVKGKTVRMMSPTGKAAQVLSDKTHGPAATIHRSLKMKPGDEVPQETIIEDIVVIDEVSMVGVDTMYAIFYALAGNSKAHIVFVGDANQLPSVSPGNFLADIMASGCANVVRLDKIHRQDENSYISLVANQIALGKVSEVPDDASDMAWNKCTSDTFPMTLCAHVNRFLEKHDIDDLQLLAPMYRGNSGIDNINSIMQQMMVERNGTKDHHLKKGFREFYKGDRVIQLENDYEKEVFNGDMGYVTELGRKVVNPKKTDKPEDYIIVEFYGSPKLYVGEQIDQLKLAWCCSVHKYQGSQSPFVFFVLAQEARIMMTKELVYTAFTRAEKFLNLYGSIDMLRLAPQRSAIKRRYTNLCKMIQEEATGKDLFITLTA